MKSNLGLFDLDVLRDGEGSFEPAIVKKHHTYVSHLESAVIGMDASPTLISNTTDKVIPMLKE